MSDTTKQRVLSLLQDTNPDAHLIDYTFGLNGYSLDIEFYELGRPPQSKRLQLHVKKYKWLTAA